MENTNIREMVEDTMRELEQVEYKYYNAYNGYIFQLATYLYLRNGEIPKEFDENKLALLMDNIRDKETLFNEDINICLEDLINENMEM